MPRIVHPVEREVRELPRQRARSSARRGAPGPRSRGRPSGDVDPRRTGLGANRFSTVPSSETTALADPRRVERAAVGDRGVAAGELQRREDRVALADREVHRVAGAVGVALDAELAGEPVDEVVAVLARRARSSSPSSPRSSRASTAGRRSGRPPPRAGRCRSRLPKPNALAVRTSGSARLHVVDVGAVALPVVEADPVEERVARDLERPGEADVAVGARLVVLEVAVADPERTTSS